MREWVAVCEAWWGTYREREKGTEVKINTSIKSARGLIVVVKATSNGRPATVCQSALRDF